MRSPTPPNLECHPASPTINEDQVKRTASSFLLDLHEFSCGNLKIIRIPSLALKNLMRNN